MTPILQVQNSFLQLQFLQLCDDEDYYCYYYNVIIAIKYYCCVPLEGNYVNPGQRKVVAMVTVCVHNVLCIIGWSRSARSNNTNIFYLLTPPKSFCSLFPG